MCTCGGGAGCDAAELVVGAIGVSLKVRLVVMRPDSLGRTRMAAHGVLVSGPMLWPVMACLPNFAFKSK